MSHDDWGTSNERFDNQKSGVFQIVANGFLNNGKFDLLSLSRKEETVVLTSSTEVLLDLCTRTLCLRLWKPWHGRWEEITPILLQFVSIKRRHHEMAAGYSMFCQGDFVAKLSYRAKNYQASRIR